MTVRFSKRLAAAAFCALVASLSTVPAGGQPQHLGGAGSWEAFGGIEPSLKKQGCSVQYDDGNRHFVIRYFQQDHDFSVDLGDKSWTVTNGSHQKLFLSMDNQGEWEIVGVGTHFPDGIAGLEFGFPFDQIDHFMGQFRAAHVMRVRFAAPGIPTWTLSLDGTTAVTDAMLICLRGLPH